VEEVAVMSNDVDMISAEDATRVVRPEFGAWTWPRVVEVMISDSFKVEGLLGQHAANGDPLAHAYALNFLETLYSNGYALVRLRP
jgi:hypothetical protein